MRLKGKCTVVTGGARGIGKAIAKRFIAEGAKVVIADIDSVQGSNAAEEIGASFHKTDVSSKIEVEALVEQVVQMFGSIDVVVNNAAVIHKSELLDLEESDYDRVLDVNLKGPFLLAQAAARFMVKQKSGSIVNLASINSQLTMPDHIPYAAAKGGVVLLTKVLALSLIPHGVRVNAVAPGTVKTELSDVVLRNANIEKQVLSRTPIGRFGKPEEIASVVAFLASDEASFIVGQTIYAEGGRLALNYTMPDGKDL
ncbi:MAG: dehydrogenase [Candidatus Marinimicrobia bacterium]|nr:dehydrogenase [Candidatus Neomarinimicrobiota bacterium]